MKVNRKKLSAYCEKKDRILIDISPDGNVYSYDKGGITDLLDYVPDEFKEG